MNKDKLEKLEKIAQKEGTPILVMDHAQIRRNYKEFTEKLPRVQVYYAVKANSEREIIETLFKEEASFDVASLKEFLLVLDVIKTLPPKTLDNFIWNNIIYANPVKETDSLHVLDKYKPLLTYDSIEEMEKITKHCPEAGVLLRLKVSDEGSVVKFSNKFGIEPKEAVDLIEKTINSGLTVEGVSFHAGSQCNDPQNFVKALKSAAYIFKEADLRGITIGESVTRGYPVKILDIGGGFPIKYNGNEQSFTGLAKTINKELDRLFPIDKVDVLAEPGRFLVGNAGTEVASIILAKHSKKPICYHLNTGVYHDFSSMIYDHAPINLESFKEGEKSECYVFGPTCDGLDTLSENEYIHNTSRIFLPKLSDGDMVYAENMGAYTNASATNFNGYPPAKVVHINMKQSISVISKYAENNGQSS
ncbi:MAG: type III PLP-dependent enzyme [Candidatus Nanoarchaeia archaeon]|nr:type III PLP-dependent enzyme [Candidatus Nanoarchaeia archaeon]MDD5740611.1 type III PLP-dependent enzyme [Candidatus Nanoarchaeia archaeon]